MVLAPSAVEPPTTSSPASVETPVRRSAAETLAGEYGFVAQASPTASPARQAIVITHTVDAYAAIELPAGMVVRIANPPIAAPAMLDRTTALPSPVVGDELPDSAKPIDPPASQTPASDEQQAGMGTILNLASAVTQESLDNSSAWKRIGLLVSAGIVIGTYVLERQRKRPVKDRYQP